MLNRKLIGLLALLLSAGLSLSACGDDDNGESSNNAANNVNPDAGGQDTEDEGDGGGVSADAEDDDDTTPDPDAGDNDTTGGEGCTEGSCAEGYLCNTGTSLCEPAPTGCDLPEAERPERCEQTGTDTEFGPASRVTTFYVNGEEGDEDCCFDLNGDDQPDNALGILNSLGDVNGSIADSITSGSLVLMFEHAGLTEIPSNAPYTLNVWLGESFEGPTVPDTLTIDPTSVDQGSYPQASLANANIEDGVLTAGPGIIDVTIALEGLLDAPLSLRISKAQIEGTVDSSSSIEDGIVIKDENAALTGGKLGGAIRVDDLVKALNGYTASSCECYGLDGDDLVTYSGPGTLSCVDLPEPGEGGYTCEEDSTCASVVGVCEQLSVLDLLVDVDTDGDGTDDALSIGVRLDAEATQIDGIGTGTSN